MSNTRKSTYGTGFRQERFSSSIEFERGLMANLVARRCSRLIRPEDRQLIWFLQLRSHQDGGLEKFIEDFIRFLPDQAQWNPEQLRSELERICLDPAVGFNTNGRFKHFLWSPLLQYQAQHIAQQRAATVVTELGKIVNATLDYALNSHCMVLIDGLARMGKTFAAKAWCQQHPGRARYVQVPSTNDDIGFFRAIAKGIGVSININSKAQELRQRIEDALQPGDLAVVFDEAHYLWPNSHYRLARPNRINWIMTALVNHGVPVALVTTPQFIRTQKEVERKSSWTSEQFIGRIGHYERLPDRLSQNDLAKVARALLPEGDRKSIETLIAYAEASAKYLAGIDYAVRRARYLAAKENRNAVSFTDIKLAIQENVIPSDSALTQTLRQTIKSQTRFGNGAAASMQPGGNAAAERLTGSSR
jgi:histone H3/H4